MDLCEEIPPGSVELNRTITNLSISNNCTLQNGTIVPDQPSMVKMIFDNLLIVNTIVMMTAMGCTLTKEQLLQNFKRPVGIGIGMFSQFIILPLSGFSMAKIIGIDDLIATGVLLISCCPGGMVSNIITYYCDGDVSLSVAMTSSSTFLAMGLMPLNLWIYGRSFDTGDMSIPYANLAVALIMVTSPVIVGMVIRWKWPRTAYVMSKVGSFSSMLITFVLIVLMSVWFPHMLIGGETTMYAAVMTLPFLGLILGYVSASVFRQSRKVCKTIAIESGMQNGALAMAMVALSFPPEEQENLLRIPVLYSITTLFLCIFVCVLYQLCKKCVNPKKLESEDISKENKEEQRQEEMERTV